MRFNILLTASLLCTLVSGLVVPSKLAERDTDLEAREFFDDDIVEFAARAPQNKHWENLKAKVVHGGIKKQYTVPAGGGRPAQTYSRQDVKSVVTAAKAEQQRLRDPALSATQRRKSLLKTFNNNDHQVPRTPADGRKSLNNMRGSGVEYPLRNAAQGPATWKDKGPARVIMATNFLGKLKFKGVVAHDQNRPLPAPGTPAAPGTHDHFKIKGTNRP